jgi:ribosomal protein S18 acetylase RimI-like enzyme
MTEVSQALLEFANHHRPRPEPGTEVIVTPRYLMTLVPDFPIPGPNNVSFIRCRPDETDEVIRDVREVFKSRRLPLMWQLDPETEPASLADHLERHGIHADPHGSEFAVMVLPVNSNLDAPEIPGLQIHDALAELATFRSANAAAAEAFESPIPGDDPAVIAMQERRRQNLLAAGHRHLLLATVDGEPAGSAGIGLFPPGGAAITGGSVRPKFRGRGIYRALVAARLEIARKAGVDGLCVWGGAMSGPILSGLGFEKVGWRRFYLDTSTLK